MLTPKGGRMDTDVTILGTHDLVDWNRLADIFVHAHFATRLPADLQKAFTNSYACCFAFHIHNDGDSSHACPGAPNGALLGAARAISDGVYYAVVLDVVVATEHQGHGVGRALMTALLAQLPLEKIYLTAPPDKQDFYKKLGFYKHNNTMARYAHPEAAFEQGVLSKRAPWSLARLSRNFTGSKPSNNQMFE